MLAADCKCYCKLNQVRYNYVMSPPRGKNISEVEVSHIDIHSLRLCVEDKEYFLRRVIAYCEKLLADPEEPRAQNAKREGLPVW